MKDKTRSSILFRSAALLAVVAFALVNIVFHFSVKNNEAMLSLPALGDLQTAKATGKIASWWLAHAYLSQKSPPDIVVFGSSQLGGLQAADADLLNAKQDYVLDHESVSVESKLKQHHINATCFAIGMVGSMISDHYLIGRVLFGPERTPKLIVVTVSPRDFIDSYLPSVTSTEVFRFFSPYVKDSVISSDLLSDPVEKMSWYLTTGLPIRSAWRIGRTESDAIESSEQPKKPMQRMTQDPLLTTNNDSMSNIRPGQCVVVPHMADFFVDNARDYKKRYSNCQGSMYQRQLTCLTKLLASSRQRHINVLVVGMPLDVSNHTLLSESFWNDYRQQIQRACDKDGASMIELSHDAAFGRSEFVDGVHLNARGGEKLAGKIADAISASPNLVASLSKGSSADELAKLATGPAKQQ